MRDTPNFDDANFAVRLYDLRRESEMRKARMVIANVLDGADWETLDAVRQWGHKHNRHFSQATSYWEMVASFVNRGIFHPDVYLDTCGEGLYTYSVLKPHVARMRDAGSPRFMMQTEQLVAANPACRERLEMVDKMRAAWFEKAAAEKAKKPAAKKAAKKNTLTKQTARR